MVVDYLQTLDNILRYLKSPERNLLPGEINKEFFPAISARLFISAMDKLNKDGYLIDNAKDVSQIEMKHFVISFAGLVFIEEGGYKARAKKEATQKFLLSVEKWLIVGGTAAAGLYGLYELIKAIFFPC